VLLNFGPNQLVIRTMTIFFVYAAVNDNYFIVENIS